jgi:hypothetical protein
MSPVEIDAYLTTERTCRVATVGIHGPHVAPLWFVWVDDALWLNSVVRSQRWRDISLNPDIAVVIDSGEAYDELRGIEILGRAEPIGGVPRTSMPSIQLAAVEAEYAGKYAGTTTFVPDGRHAWLCVRPTKITSWDFRKR